MPVTCVCLPSGVGGIETEAVMLGLPVSLTLPEVVGCELTGSSNPFVTSIDVVLGITKVRSGCASHVTQCTRLYMRRGPLRPLCSNGSEHRRLPVPDSSLHRCPLGVLVRYSCSQAPRSALLLATHSPLSSEKQTQEG